MNKTTGIRNQFLIYLPLAAVFFLISALSIYFVHHIFSDGSFRFPPGFFSPGTIALLLSMLLLYFVFDGLRLYSVIRAVGGRLPFIYIFRLVFINILISNATPMAAGGGFAQIYFMQQKGMSIGAATAATTIRTLLAALVLFTLAPVIIWIKPQMFTMFIHRNILYTITLVSILYIALILLLAFGMKLFRRILFSILLALTRIKLMSRARFRKIFLRLSGELKIFSRSFNGFIHNSPLWSLLSIMFTVLFLLMLFSFSLVLLHLMDYQIPAVTVLTFQVVITFFMYFAPTPGASGVAEGGFGLLFSQLVKPGDITSLTLLWRFLTIYIGVFTGIAVMIRELIRIRKRLGT